MEDKIEKLKIIAEIQGLQYDEMLYRLKIERMRKLAKDQRTLKAKVEAWKKVNKELRKFDLFWRAASEKIWRLEDRLAEIDAD